jgi:hypothetical protein
MKDKIFLSILIIFILGSSSYIHSQSIDERSYIKKYRFYENPTHFIIDNIYIDGISINTNDKIEYLFIYFDTPQCCQNGLSEIIFNHIIKKGDDVLIDTLIKTKIESNFYPTYWANTLNILKFKDENIFYFYTSLSNNLVGLDPYNIILWIFLKNNIYTFRGSIPKHEDWSWDTYYSIEYSDKLNNEFPSIYLEMVKIWNKDIQNYKRNFYKNE